MGKLFNPIRSAAWMTASSLVLLLVGGCQMGASIPAARLIQQQALIDPTGLKESEVCAAAKVHIAAPAKWTALQRKRTALYTHMQWRSPNGMTGVGVCYVHLPIPLPADMIVWLAKQEYAKSAQDGKLLGEWTDSLGRPWFEAMTSKYHVRGYVISKGFEAWIIYCGYKVEQPPSAVDLGVAARSLETIVPTPIAKQIPHRPMAEARTAGDHDRS